MSYLIRTNYFGLTLSDLHLLRSGFSYRRIPHESIKHISIEKGIRTKHPIRSIVFGLILILSSAWLLINSLNLNLLEPGFSDNLAYKVVWGWWMMMGFLALLGFVSVFWALKRTLILKVITLDGQKELFTLNELQKKNKLSELKKFINEIYPPHVRSV